MSVDEMAAAARRGAVTIATDPAMRHYAPDTLALVYERTITNLAGAGDLDNMAARMASDPALADVPADVVEAITVTAVAHFAAALATASLATPPVPGIERDGGR